MTTYKYVEDKTIRRLRVKTWVDQVLATSNLFISELQQQFSDLNEGNNHSCIWYKYSKGTTVPRIGENPKGKLYLANRVDKAYPGTMEWLTSPVWRLADDAPMTMSEIRTIFENMPYLFNSIFIEAKHKIKGVFWRRQVELELCLNTLSNLDTLDAFIALLAMLKEAEIKQDQETHEIVFEEVFKYEEKLQRYPALENTCIGLFQYLDMRYKRANYFYE